MMVAVFGDLRRDLEAQRDLICARLEAVDDCEAAFARLREAFSQDAPRGAVEPHQRAVPVSGPNPPLVRADPPAPGDGQRAGGARAAVEQPESRACLECGAAFTPRRSGHPHLYCSPRCRQRATPSGGLANSSCRCYIEPVVHRLGANPEG
jgi:hypothetical protein